MEFVSFIGEDSENWGQIKAIINRIDSAKIILLKNKNAPAFPTSPKTVIINVDSDMPLLELKQDIIDKLKNEISKEFEVGVSLASGSGKEHMALISALLSVPVGIRLVVYTKEGLQYIN
jgi:hypothetical protein